MTEDTDDRTKAYLEAIEDQIDLIDYSYAGETSIPKRFRTEDVDHEQVTTFVIGKTVGQGDVQATVYAYTSPNDGRERFVATWGQRIDIDAVGFTALTFTSEPSLEDVQTAREVEKARRAIQNGKIETTFTCWECGNETHWLDTHVDGENDLSARVDRAKRSYCGC